MIQPIVLVILLNMLYGSCITASSKRSYLTQVFRIDHGRDRRDISTEKETHGFRVYHGKLVEQKDVEQKGVAELGVDQHSVYEIVDGIDNAKPNVAKQEEQHSVDELVNRTDNTTPDVSKIDEHHSVDKFGNEIDNGSPEVETVTDETVQEFPGAMDDDSNQAKRSVRSVSNLTPPWITMRYLTRDLFKTPNIIKLFIQLGKIAGTVNEGFSQARNKSEQMFKSFKGNSETIKLKNKIITLEKNISKLMGQKALCPNPFISTFALSKKISNGVITCEGKKVGDRCSVKCSKGCYPYPTNSTVCTIQGIWENDIPVCNKVKSCQEILRYNPKAKSDIYTIWSKDNSVQYDVYCEMDNDGGGWTLVAVVANGDAKSWTYNDNDGDYGDLKSLWENSLTLGNVTGNTATTAKDFKSQAYFEIPARELLITFKGKNYIQTDGSCLGGHSMKELFNIFRFSCAGSKYNCYYSKCLNTGGNGVSKLCYHQCNVAKFHQGNGASGEPLSNGKLPSKLYLKVGEAEKAQDGNKDRVYISTFPYRNNIDYVPGLGSFTALKGKKYSYDIGKHHDISNPVSNKLLYYGIFIR